MAFDIFWMNAAAVLAFANIALVLTLSLLYLQSWRKVRSTFAASLLLFAVFFLIQSLVIVLFWYVLYGLVPASQSIVVAAAPYLVAINLLEMVGLGNLVRVTWK